MIYMEMIMNNPSQQQSLIEDFNSGRKTEFITEINGDDFKKKKK